MDQLYKKKKNLKSILSQYLLRGDLKINCLREKILTIFWGFKIYVKHTITIEQRTGGVKWKYTAIKFLLCV